MSKTDILHGRALKTLLYIYEHGTIYGYIELAKTMHMGPHTMKNVLLTLELMGLVSKKVGPNNIYIYNLTEKGKKIAEKTKEIVKMLEES